VPHREFEAPFIANIFAVVVAERLLIEVAEQMKRFDTHIGSVNATLQQAPVVLQLIGVYASVYVLDCMVNNLVSVLASKSAIASISSV
jgi:hypothetical protein